jgi:putative flippase GtrA
MIIAPPESALVPVSSSWSTGAAALALTVPAPSPRKERLRDRFFTLIRMLVVGLWSSGVDLAVLALCVRWFQVDATLSRGIALVVSGLLLFFGCRSYAFRAQAGCVARQARRFVAAELVGFFLNLLVFHALGLGVPFIAPEITSQAANFFVFVGFSYPVRRWLIFRAAVIPPLVRA